MNRKAHDLWYGSAITHKWICWKFFNTLPFPPRGSIYSILSLAAVKQPLLLRSASVVFLIRSAVFLFFPWTVLASQFQITWPHLLDRLVSLKLQVGGEELGVLWVGRGKGLKFTWRINSAEKSIRMQHRLKNIKEKLYFCIFVAFHIQRSYI